MFVGVFVFRTLNPHTFYSENVPQMAANRNLPS